MLSKTACLRIMKGNREQEEEQELSVALHDAVTWKIMSEGWLYESEVGQIRV